MTPEGSPIQLRVRYKTMRVVVGKDNLRYFQAMEHARPVMDKEVSKLYHKLLSGRHFESVVVVNVVHDARRQRDIYRVIDGNHRLEAIKRWVKEDPVNRSIEVTFAVYKGLSDPEEREVFAEWNIGRRQTLSHHIDVNQEDYPIYRSMLGYFPAGTTLYGVRKSQKAFQFMPLMRGYLGRKGYAAYHTPSMEETLAAIRELGEKDYEWLKQFANDFIEAFGDPARDNPFNATLSLGVLQQVYYQNVGYLTRNNIVERWKMKVASDPNVRQWARAFGSTAHKPLMEAILAAMNRGYRKRLALAPTTVAKVEEVEA